MLRSSLLFGSMRIAFSCASESISCCRIAAIALLIVESRPNALYFTISKRVDSSDIQSNGDDTVVDFIESNRLLQVYPTPGELTRGRTHDPISIGVGTVPALQVHPFERVDGWVSRGDMTPNVLLAACSKGAMLACITGTNLHSLYWNYSIVGSL